jgi:hypothetical protein
MASLMAGELSEDNRRIIEAYRAEERRKEQEKAALQAQQINETKEAAAAARLNSEQANTKVGELAGQFSNLQNAATGETLKQRKNILKIKYNELKDKINRKDISYDDAIQEFNILVGKFDEIGIKLKQADGTQLEKKWNEFQSTYDERVKFDKILNAKRESDAVSTADMLKLMENSSNIRMVNLRNYIIKRTGREYGPDIALKVVPPKTDVSPKIEKIINKNSSITDVLNIVAFLINNEKERSYWPELSIEYGEHDETGKYTEGANDSKISSADSSAGEVSTWKLSLANKEAPFDIETYTVPASLTSGGVIIPQGILKRKIDYAPNGPITLNDDEIKELFRECIKQMIYIMDNTRKVFTGWTKLFKETSGGSSRSKSKTKKKHHHDHDK